MSCEYGKYYWGFIYIKNDGKTEIHYINADIVEIKDGDLIFIAQNKILFSVAKGNWKVFFAASVLDGRPVSQANDMSLIF